MNRKKVRGNLTYALGYEEVDAEAARDLHRTYPNTFPIWWKQSLVTR